MREIRRLIRELKQENARLHMDLARTAAELTQARGENAELRSTLDMLQYANREGEQRVGRS